MSLPHGHYSYSPGTSGKSVVVADCHIEFRMFFGTQNQKNGRDGVSAFSLTGELDLSGVSASDFTFSIFSLLSAGISPSTVSGTMSSTPKSRVETWWQAWTRYVMRGLVTILAQSGQTKVLQAAVIADIRLCSSNQLNNQVVTYF
ncbi:uncharacterized protein LOC135833287 [Planococcus citri]|uniref:uncharacterized protein LOC135833287 n=1 Tax=Planococcus citri TaxID=170843 RepID=UPI0031F908DE